MFAAKEVSRVDVLQASVEADARPDPASKRPQPASGCMTKAQSQLIAVQNEVRRMELELRQKFASVFERYSNGGNIVIQVYCLIPFEDQ